MYLILRTGLVVGAVSLIIGCSDATNPPATVTAEAATPAVFNAAGAPTVEFSVPDMMCPEGCGEKTKEILAKQPGAKEVVIDFDAKTATVAVEPDAFDPQQAVAAMVDYGFDNTALKEAADAKPEAAASVQ